METNKDKFKVFTWLTKELNKKFKITPVLYGSVGLNKCIGEFVEAADIDILILEKIIKFKWSELVKFMQIRGYRLKDKHEHEFSNGKEIIAFGLEENLTRDAGINLNELKRTELSGTKFKELSAKHFLKAYKFCLKDGYRQEKRGNADLKKIKLIRKYLKQNEN